MLVKHKCVKARKTRIKFKSEVHLSSHEWKFLDVAFEKDILSPWKPFAQIQRKSYKSAIALLYHIFPNTYALLDRVPIDQSPAILPAMKLLITPSAANSDSAASNSWSSSLKVDTEDFPGDGKYSASISHLDIRWVCFQYFREGRNLTLHLLPEARPHWNIDWHVSQYKGKAYWDCSDHMTSAPRNPSRQSCYGPSSLMLMDKRDHK